jgi:hypothetical protein
VRQGAEVWSVPSRVGFSRWRERFHGAAVTLGGELDFCSLSLSMTTSDHHTWANTRAHSARNTTKRNTAQFWRGQCGVFDPRSGQQQRAGSKKALPGDRAKR